jgi:hypothetical protein
MLPVLFLTTRYIRAGGFFILAPILIQIQSFIQGLLFFSSCLVSFNCYVIIVEEPESGRCSILSDFSGAWRMYKVPLGWKLAVVRKQVI